MTRDLEKMVRHSAFASSARQSLERISADGAPAAYSKALMNAIDALAHLGGEIIRAKEDKRISEI
jgi:hypothetical protein